MKIITLIKYLICLVPVAFGAMACLFLYRNRENRKYLKDREYLKTWMKEGLQRLKDRGRTVILLTVLYAVCFLSISALKSWTDASTVIGLNYKEASQGLNPNSTRFNTYDIICDEVLEATLQRLGSGLSVQELRGTLSVFPCEAGEISSEQPYISTEYQLRYTAQPKTLLLNPRKTVDTVAEIYRERFKQFYEQKTNVLDIDSDRIEDADYFDKADIMEKMASGIQQYMEGCQLNNSAFRSSSGETFVDVATRAGTFSNVTLERLRAYILEHGISKDRDQYISRLNYENTIQNVSYSQNMAAYQIRMDAINYYERDLTRVVLVPTRDTNGEFYMSRTKIGVDDFAAEAESFTQSASDSQKRMETNRYEIGRLQQGVPADSTMVDQLLENAERELSSISDSAKQILEEYDNEYVKERLVITPQGRSLKKILSVKWGGIMTAGFFLMAAVLAILYPEKKRRQTGGR